MSLGFVVSVTGMAVYLLIYTCKGTIDGGEEINRIHQMLYSEAGHKIKRKNLHNINMH